MFPRRCVTARNNFARAAIESRSVSRRSGEEKPEGGGGAVLRVSRARCVCVRARPFARFLSITVVAGDRSKGEFRITSESRLWCNYSEREPVEN